MKYDFVKPEVYYAGEIEPFKPFKLFIEPLPKGFGETLANQLRRILLTYIHGTGIIGFKIPKVVHEMQEIPNSSTDTVYLIRNLKEVKFKIEGDTEEIKVIRLETKKAGPVYAKDLILPSGVTVMNPNQEILLLNGDGDFEAEFYIKKGYGDKYAHEHEEFKNRPDIIKIDTIFSPIKSVGYEVGTARVGDEANYDKIEFTIKSDGSVHPKEAIETSIHLMMNFYGLFLEMSDVADKTKLYKEKKEERDRLMDTPIELLNLSQRSYNALKKAEMNLVRDLAELDKKTLGAIQQLGKKSVEEIIEVLEFKGIKIPD